ncbi:uncharacterized protein CIMG_02626 [Coccidioides immitis RS]|uniref:Uncharacterized protein n=2 Tax=Coccidioides immitis TaxID=5501 RepID=J3KLR8_COCIM|nr:uncharacterized protein CIMG_02626 [Coccidioides immitis RS]EAS37272.3 hypothetical protein CIMG_02626 [Coccidioides immitis RS]KMP02147.1 hypothetical protein CIRG_09970 [Coccidioides immitis RMSCC 2394]TPX24757.1 hypothetical protein DIZ76_010198 [Coccidioides immitis]
MASRSHFTRIPSASSSNASTTIADTNRPISSRPIPPAAPSTVRRNLFHAHLSRRQHNSSTSTSSLGTSRNRTHTRTISGSGDGSGMSSTLGGGILKSRLMTGVLSLNCSLPDEGDIVARDKNGTYKVDVPILQPGSLGEGAGDEDADEVMEAVESVGHTGLEHDGGISCADKEKIEASIAELMRRNRSRQMNSEPSEVYLLIQQSLKNRVTLLDEDRWMFEIEDGSHT